MTLVSGFLSDQPSPCSVPQGAIHGASEPLGLGSAQERVPVRVYIVSPGLIVTPPWSDMGKAIRNVIYERTAARLPVWRIGHPEHPTRAILVGVTSLLATDSAVTGDGGGTVAQGALRCHT